MDYIPRRLESQLRHHIVCRSPRRMRVTDRVDAVPWQELQAVVEG